MTGLLKQFDLDDNKRDQIRRYNLQDYLVCHAATGAAANTGAVGKRLVDAGALTNGVYYCAVALSGLLVQVQCDLNATFADGSCTTVFGTAYLIPTVNSATAGGAPSITTYTERQGAASGEGAMTTTVLQQPLIDALDGEEYAILKITVASSTLGATFTLAEVVGK